MVSVNTSYYPASYANAAHTRTAASPATSATPATAARTEAAAANVTLSDAATLAIDERDYAAVSADARRKLDALLTEAARTSPLEGKYLALDLSSLDQRELYAMASADVFATDEQQAAALEMQRRLEAALAGPAAIADVTGNYVGLYKAAAAYLDSLSPEEKQGADWIHGREAVTEGLKQLQSNPHALPQAGENDPVALYLQLVEAGETGGGQDSATTAAGTRRALDRLYGQAIADGKAPTFNRNTTVGTYIDLSAFSSAALSVMALDIGELFTPEESRAAQAVLRGKTGAVLSAGFKDAQKSGDPAAFSQNIIAAFSSLTPEERHAAGWSDQLYRAAVENYASTQKLLQMFSQAGGSPGGGAMSWLGR